MRMNKTIALAAVFAGLMMSSTSNAQDSSGSTTATATSVAPTNGGEYQGHRHFKGRFVALNYGICSLQNNCPVNPVAQCVVNNATQQKVTIPPMPAKPARGAGQAAWQTFKAAMKARHEAIKPLLKGCFQKNSSPTAS